MLSSLKKISRHTRRNLCTHPQHNVNNNTPHKPVMLDEVIKSLKPQDNQVILDMTFGSGGHSRKILESASNIKLIALDCDPVAFNYAEKLVNDYPNQVIPLRGKFSELPCFLRDLKIKQRSFDAVLFDFGCSSMQFDSAKRGFSVSKNGPLDMRMEGDLYSENPTAADVLAKASEEDIYKIIKIYGEEKKARKIARTIIEARYLFKKLTTTQDLADLVDSVFEDDYSRVDKLQRRVHNATKTFQALRIFVNNELNEINYGLLLAQHYLKLGGRIVTITFHSLEDTIVKRHLLGNLIGNTINPLPLKYSSCSTSIDSDVIHNVMKSNWKSLYKHVLTPSLEEIESNPRSRSARLRAAVRIN